MTSTRLVLHISAIYLLLSTLFSLKFDPELAERGSNKYDRIRSPLNETLGQFKCPFSASSPRKDSPVHSKMCQGFNSASAMSLWVEHLDQILYYGRLRRDRRFSQHDMMLEVMKIILPRLHLSTNAMPRDMEKVGMVLQKAWDRYQWLEQRKSNKSDTVLEEPPVVNIVVLGGSVTFGNNCFALKGSHLHRCAWPARLETFLNRFFGYTVADIVSVHNLAIGGTNTKTAKAMFDYDLLPERAKKPDIVINAYATNDMHVDTIREATAAGRNLSDHISDITQSFARTIMTPSRCDPSSPLLVWLDDYLGNEQNELKSISRYSQEIHTLASYYGFAFWSYPNMVRDIVYGDTRGTLFAPPWYKTGSYMREIHYGEGMHLSTFWLVSYNLLLLATHYCALEPSFIHLSNVFPAPRGGRFQVNTTLKRHDTKPEGLPPVLTEDLNLRRISRKWQSDATKRETEQKPCSTNKEKSRCSFSWLSGIERDETVQSVQKRFGQFVRSMGSWEITDGGHVGKIGFSPRSQVEAHIPFIVEVESLEASVSNLVLFVMKSYGEIWDGSQASFGVYRANQQLASVDISGYHGRNTSEVYTETLDLNSTIDEGESLRLKVSLSGGSMFKLMGMAFCD